MRSYLKIFLFLILTLIGCSASTPPEGYVECPVCKRNGDMACLWVKPEIDTPSLEENGKTLYFCSEECKKDYLKQTDEGNASAFSCDIKKSCAK